VSRDIIQQQFLELVKTGLFPDHNARILPHGNSVDWDMLYRLAEEQSVMGLIAAGIENLPASERPSKEVVLQFIGSTFQLEQRNKAMNTFVAKLMEQLRAEDIYAILVKGQGIAQCYEKPLWRACGDVDLLLSESNYERAKELLCPLAADVETEYTHFKHQGMNIDGWVVELHGTLHSRLSKRVDRLIDEVQKDVFYGGNVRSWDNSGTQVFLPSPDNDVIFVFTHILHHFFFEGIGLRQICDWCRLLWTYKDSLNHKLLESRIRKMSLMSEWKAFAAFVVKWLGMPVEAMPLFEDIDNHNVNLDKKADKICKFVLEVGNFGHKQRRDYSGMSYLKRKFVSVWGRLSDMLRHFQLFPKDSIVFFGGVLRSGLHAAVRGE
jgi:hypothetical protein